MLDLDTIVGHKTEVQQLGVLLEKRSIPHAMLFCGPPGIGKRCTALAFAAEILARNKLGVPAEIIVENADQAAQAKRLLAVGNHPDLHLIAKEAEKKEITVDSIRELRSILRLKPYLAGSSVIIINDAHFLNTPAANALLMTLEEPPGDSYLILLSHAPHRLPSTIVSRCQSLYFAPLKAEEVRQIVQQTLGPLVDDQGMLDTLCSLAVDSLDPLGIDMFFDAKTSRVCDEKELIIYLKELSVKLQTLQTKLQTVFTGNQQSPAEQAALSVALAANLAAEKDGLEFSWKLVQAEIRKKMRSTKGEKAVGWADTLLAALEAQELTRERNLNSQLQMSSVLLRT